MPVKPKKRWRSSVVFNRIIEACARTAELHPIIWKAAWEAMHWLPFLLPHDKSYNALRHFIAIKPGGLFLDVGANDGISVLSFRRFDKKARILALEPNPLLEPALKRIQSADPLLDYRMVGASFTSTSVQFFVPIYKKMALHTFTSSNYEQAKAAVQRSFGGSVAAATEIKSFTCEVVKIDDLNVDPSIIKIDAEGCDYDVLCGLTATIRRSRPFVITEIGAGEFGRIKEYFDALQYVLLAYDILHDCFRSDVEAYRSAIIAMSGHRNFFAVPRERMAYLPIA
jgi:FkbM family methyltransferase